MDGVGSKSEGEGKLDFEGTTTVTDRGALRLRAPIKTQWNSVFDALIEPCNQRMHSPSSQRMIWNWMGGSTAKMMKMRQMGKWA